MAVQVNQYRSFQCLILDADGIAIQIQVSSDIIQQNDQICTFCDSRQLSSSCQTSLIGNAVCCHIYKQGSIICVHIFNMTGQIDVDTCIVLCNDLGQIDFTRSILVVNIVIQGVLNQIQNFLHPDILQGDVYALIVVDDLFAVVGVGDHLVDHLCLFGAYAVKDLLVYFLNLIYANTVNQHISCVHNGIPFGSILIQHGIEHIYQERQSNLGIQLIDMAQLDLAGCNQCCNICCIYRLRHSQMCNSLAVLEGELEILIDLYDTISQTLHFVLCAIQGDIEISLQHMAILFKVGRGVHNFCAQGVVLIIGQHSCIGNFQMLQGAVLIDFLQEGMGACAAVEHSIDKCLEVVLAFTVEHMVIKADVVITAHKQACTKLCDLILKSGLLHTEDHGVLAVSILCYDSGAFHMVYEINQHILLQLQALLRLVDFQTNDLHCAGYQFLKLINGQFICASIYYQLADLIIVTHTVNSMCRQIQVHIVIVYITNYHIGAVNYDFIVFHIPGVVEFQRFTGQRNIFKIVADCEIFRILRSDVVSSHHSLCPSIQLIHGQGCAGSFHMVLSESHTAKGNIQHHIGVCQTGNMYILLPLECRYAAVQVGTGGFQQIQQGTEVLIFNIDLGVVHTVVLHNICCIIQSSSDFLEQILGSHMNNVHKCTIVHQYIQKLIQLDDLCLVQGFILIVMVHSTVGVQFHCIVQSHVAVYGNQLVQSLTGSNGFIAEAVGCLQVLDHTQRFAQSHMCGRSNDIVFVIELLQHGHQSCQLIQSSFLCVVLRSQLVRCIQRIQNFNSREAQSLNDCILDIALSSPHIGAGNLCIQNQLIVHICHLEVAVGSCLINAVYHRIGNTVNSNGGCNPGQTFQTGSIVRCNDYGCLLNCIIRNRNLFLTRHTNTKCICQLQSRACQDVLNVGVDFYSLSNQVQNIHSLCLLAFATGNQSILRNRQYTALLQLAGFTGDNCVDILHSFRSMSLGGVAIAVGYIQNLFFATKVQRQLVGLGGEDYGVLQIAFQQEVVCQFLYLNIKLACINAPLCQRIVKQSGFFNCSLDLSAGSAAGQCNGVLIVRQCDQFHRIILCGIYNACLVFYINIELRNINLNGCLSNMQHFRNFTGVSSCASNGLLDLCVDFSGQVTLQQLGCAEAVVFKGIHYRLYSSLEAIHDDNEQLQVVRLLLQLCYAFVELIQKHSHLIHFDNGFICCDHQSQSVNGILCQFHLFSDFRNLFLCFFYSKQLALCIFQHYQSFFSLCQGFLTLCQQSCSFFSLCQGFLALCQQDQSFLNLC